MVHSSGILPFSVRSHFTAIMSCNRPAALSRTAHSAIPSLRHAFVSTDTAPGHGVLGQSLARETSVIREEVSVLWQVRRAASFSFRVSLVRVIST